MANYCTYFNVNGGLSGWSNSYVATKVGAWNKTVAEQNHHRTWCSWANRCLQEIGVGKGQHTCAWAVGCTGVLQQ